MKIKKENVYNEPLQKQYVEETMLVTVTLVSVILLIIKYTTSNYPARKWAMEGKVC